MDEDTSALEQMLADEEIGEPIAKSRKQLPKRVDDTAAAFKAAGLHFDENFSDPAYADCPGYAKIPQREKLVIQLCDYLHPLSQSGDEELLDLLLG